MQDHPIPTVSNGPWVSNVLNIVGAELAAVARFEFLPVSWREAFAFGLRNWLACMLALYLAFTLQIDEPLWAALTVWQVIQPAPGMAISKGFYRIVGIVIGAVMGIVLIALFSQAPELFILALALWCGGATIAATLLTNFRGFAGVSAGFMTALVGLDAFHAPDKVFDIAMARGSATIIGIVCSTLMTTFFAPQRAQALVKSSIRQAISDTARRVAFPLGGAMADRVVLGPPLAGRLVQLETKIEFAAKESAAGRKSAGLARRLVAHLFSTLTAKVALEECLNRIGLIQDRGTVSLYREGMSLFEQVPAIMTAGRDAEVAEKTRAFSRRVGEHQQGIPLDDAQAISSQLVHDRLADLAEHFERAVAIWLDIQAGAKRGLEFQLNFHRDRRAAAINGRRAFLTVLGGGIFWIESQWASGPFLLIPMVIVTSIFASAPYPETVALNFTKGAVCGMVAAYICTFHFFTHTTGFVPFAAAQALFLIPAAMVQLNPRYTSFGLAFGIFFFLAGQPANPMNFNPSVFFNNALAIVTGAFIASMAYRLFMPPDPRRARRYVVSRMREGLKEAAQREPIPNYSDWQTRNLDRVYRLSDPANPAAVKTYEWYEGGLATVHLGDEILRLRHLLDEAVLPERVVTLGRSILRAFQKVTTEPQSVRLTLEAANATLAETILPEAEDSRIAYRRLQAVVQEMEAFFVTYPQFLSPNQKLH